MQLAEDGTYTVYQNGFADLTFRLLGGPTVEGSTLTLSVSYTINAGTAVLIGYISVPSGVPVSGIALTTGVVVTSGNTINFQIDWISPVTPSTSYDTINFAMTVVLH